MSSVSASPNLLQALRSEHLRVANNSPITETFITPPTSPFPISSNNQDSTSASPPAIFSEVATAGGRNRPAAPDRQLSSKSKPQLPHLNKPAYDEARMASTAGLGVAIDSISPVNERTPRADKPTIAGSSLASEPASAHLQPPRDHSAPPSPCFVHSLLDQGASLRNFLELNHAPSPTIDRPMHHSTTSAGSSSSGGSDSGRGSSIQSELSSSSLPNNQSSIAMSPLTSDGTHSGPGVGLAKMLHPQRHSGSQHTSSHGYGSSVDSDLSPSDEEDEGNSLTKQLAETAVGVRELAKQLGGCFLMPQHAWIRLSSHVLTFDLAAGRARVRTNIQNILIVTKARDNRLIKLTRELAIYLMLKKSGDNQRGLTVYVAPL